MDGIRAVQIDRFAQNQLLEKDQFGNWEESAQWVQLLNQNPRKKFINNLFIRSLN